jgi:hypothetical protein
MEYVFWWIIIFLVFAVLVYAFFKIKNKKKISPEKINDFNKKLSQIKSNVSSKEKIIDSDKLYHKILQEIWYVWDFWEILKENPIVISNINKIWELHKIRNKIAHEFDNYDEVFLRAKSQDYIKEISSLLKDLK